MNSLSISFSSANSGSFRFTTCHACLMIYFRPVTGSIWWWNIGVSLWTSIINFINLWIHSFQIQLPSCKARCDIEDEKEDEESGNETRPELHGMQPQNEDEKKKCSFLFVCMERDMQSALSRKKHCISVKVMHKFWQMKPSQSAQQLIARTQLRCVGLEHLYRGARSWKSLRLDRRKNVSLHV